jgi:Flp pilus assembly protein TadD
MSLLMDALKRAEKARQAEAAKQAEGEDAPEAQELALDPLEDSAARAEEEASADVPVAPGATAPPASGVPPTLEPAVGLAPPFSLQGDQRSSTPRAPAPAGRAGDSGAFSLMDDAQLSEDTADMQPVAREAEQAMNEYFDDAHSISVALGEVKASVAERAMVAPDAARSDEEARRAAQTVFDAKVPAVSRRRRGRAVLVAVPFLLVAFVGVAGFVLWDDIVRTFVGSPAVVPRRPPPLAQLPPPAESPVLTPAETLKIAAAAQASAVQSGAAASPVATTQSEFPPLPAESPLREAALAATSETPVEPAALPMSETPAPTALVGATPEPSGGAVSVAETTGDGTEATIAALTEQALTASEAARPEPFARSIRISKKSAPDRIHPLLTKAYEAFETGNNGRAKKLYESVIARDPNNANALLGLGAIAMRSGDVGRATRIYAMLLSLNPRDPVARAALIDLNQNVPPVEGESHVKKLLIREPEQPFLYFTLGNLYARQARWPEAQQAYFDAYRRDSANADYAFNLAVSLDQMGQPAAALRYYRRALELARGGNANFESQTVLRRISLISAGGSG